MVGPLDRTSRKGMKMASDVIGAPKFYQWLIAKRRHVLLQGLLYQRCSLILQLISQRILTSQWPCLCLISQINNLV